MSKLSDFMGGGLSWDIEGFMDNMVFVESVKLTTSGTHTFTEDSVVILSIQGAPGSITASGGTTLCKLDDETFLTITGGGSGGSTSISSPGINDNFFRHTVGLIGRDGKVSTSSSFPLLLPNNAPNGQMVPEPGQRRGESVRAYASSNTSSFMLAKMTDGRGAGGSPGTALVMFGVETGQELAITLGASGAQAIINIYKG